MYTNNNVNRSSSSLHRTPTESQRPADTSSLSTAVARPQGEVPQAPGLPRTSPMRTNNTRAPRGAGPGPALATASTSAAAATPEATAAGHAESFCRLGGTHIAKMTSNAEAQMYQKHGQQLRGVIPNTVPASEVASLPGVTHDQVAAFARLQTKAQDSGQSVLIMKAVGGKIAKADRREMDVKLGSRTASRTELIDSGSTPTSAFAKKLKMVAADLARGAWQPIGDNRGYSLTGRMHAGTNPDPSRFSAGRNSQANIAQTLDLPNGNGPDAAARVLEDLNTIRARMQEIPVTFVASSVLMALDEQNSANSRARLIDLAHPVEKGKGSSNYKKLNQRFDEGLGHLIDHVAKSAGQGGASSSAAVESE